MRIINTVLYITFIICTNICCNKNLEAELPSYIAIEDFNYKEPNSQNHSVNISDVWLSMDGQIIGVFEIPCTIPILSEGLHSFDIYPGIKVNGIAGNRIKYPFYEKFEIDTLIQTDETIKIEPRTLYLEQASFQFEEEGQFEIDGTILEPSSFSDTIAIIQSDTIYQGERSAAIYLDSIRTYFDVRTFSELNLTNNNITFLELNFKSNIGFSIGLVNEFEQKEELIQLYPSNNWKKIYLDFTPLIGINNTFNYKIYFEGYYNNENLTNAVYLDNLKLVYNK